MKKFVLPNIRYYYLCSNMGSPYNVAQGISYTYFFTDINDIASIGFIFQIRFTSLQKVELQCAFFFFCLSKKLEFKLIKLSTPASTLEVQCVSSAVFALLSILFHLTKGSWKCCGVLAQIRLRKRQYKMFLCVRTPHNIWL